MECYLDINISDIIVDRNLYAIEGLPLITVYDDNFFVRNDYDVLSVGQRNYLIKFLGKAGYRQTSGRTLSKGDLNIQIQTPNSNLAISSYNSNFNAESSSLIYCVTPTMFAEALFYKTLGKDHLHIIRELRKLIKVCPFNIEWLRDISYRSPIEQVTKATYDELMSFQRFIVQKRFKFKKAL